METFWQVVLAAIPVYLLIVSGIAVRSAGVLTAEADRSLLRLVINLLTPCLIIDSLLGNRLATEPMNLIAGPLLGFGVVALGFWVARSVGRSLGLNDTSARTFSFSVGLNNYGFIPVPLVLELFGRETLGVLFIYNVGTELAIWTLGLMILRGSAGGTQSIWGRIQWAPVVAVVVGVGMNLSGASPWVPASVAKLLALLGACAVPMGLILIGATVCDVWQDFRFRERWVTTLTGAGLRLVVFPAFFLALACWAPLSIQLSLVLVVQAAMPAAMLPIVLTKLERGDVPLALSIVVTTSIASFMTIPLVIKLGLLLMGVIPQS